VTTDIWLGGNEGEPSILLLFGGQSDGDAARRFMGAELQRR
jgi:hypothetical protein